MRLERINNPSQIWDKIRQWLSDDSNETISDGYFIGIFDGYKMAGAFLVKPWNCYCYEIHGGIDPDYFGRGVEVCRNVGKLFFCSPCLKIVAAIPEFNTRMRNCVQKIGLKHEGIITKSFMKNFKMHDLYLYGITKGEFRCLQH